MRFQIEIYVGPRDSYAASDRIAILARRYFGFFKADQYGIEIKKKNP